MASFIVSCLRLVLVSGLVVDCRLILAFLVFFKILLYLFKVKLGLKVLNLFAFGSFWWQLSF